METKTRKHEVADKLPVVVAIFLMILGIILPSAIASPVSSVFGGSDTMVGRVYLGIVAMLVSFLLMKLYVLWFRPEFKGNLGKDGFTKGMKLLIPFFAVWFVYFILNGIFDGAQYDLADPAVWASGFAAGVTEEVAFRGLAVTTLLRKFRSEKNIMISGILVGILFGAVHLANITAGDDPAIVLLTVAFAIGGGILFSSVYTMCGNLWTVIIAHGLYDSVSFSILEDPSSPAEIGAFTYLQIAIMFVLGILAVAVLWKNREEASALWNRKWETIA